MRKSLLLLTMPLLLALLAACGSLSESNTLTICSSLPLNNGTNARAQDMSRAIEMAIAEKGSVVLDGREYPLRYVAMDDTIPETGRWNTGQEERNARAAISEHDCIAYIGTFNSGAAKIAIPILNRVQMAMISPGNTYPGLTKPGTGLGDEPWIYSPLGPEKRNFCRVVPADDLQAPAGAQYAAQTLGVRTVALVHDTELYGKGLADIFREAAGPLNLEIVGEISINSRELYQVTESDDNDATEDVNLEASRAYALKIATDIFALASERPDMIYFGGETSSGAGHLLNALREQGYEGFFMGADAIAEDAFIEQQEMDSDIRISQNGDSRVYATLVSLPPEQLTGLGETWYRNFRNRYNTTSADAFAAPSYEAAWVVLNAIERAQVPEGDAATFLERARPAVLAAIKNQGEFSGVLGTWEFDENCDTSLRTISINQVTGTTFQLIDVVGDAATE